MSQTDEIVASAIVPSYCGAARLPQLFDSLAGQLEAPPFEVIVVIDGVDDGSVAVVDAETRFPIRRILFPENRGRVAALNAGFEAATGEVLIRCDDDLVVPPDYVRAHVDAHMNAVEPVGVVGPTRDIHEDSVYARVYGNAAAASSLSYALDRPADERWRLWAASCSITRETWDRIGPYDPMYRAYGWEDVDYGYRLHAAGIPILIAEKALAEHHGPARSVSGRVAKAFDSGAARATFHRLHPAAPLAAPSPGTGLWGTAVRAVSVGLRNDRLRRVIPRLIDRALGAVPDRIGTKLAALAVEGAGYAGAVAGRTSMTEHAAPERAPRVAIAHDYLTQRGGAERLVLSICKAFPDAEVHTLFYEPDQTYPEYRDMRIRTSPLNRIGIFRRDPRLALPLLAFFAARMRIDADVVIASSSGWAHAFPTRGRELVYCHSPARWLYLPEDYLGDAGRFDPKRFALAVLTPFLTRWDKKAAKTADHYWGNSSVVRERIRRVYGIDAPALFPPFSPEIAEGEQEPIPALAGWAGEDGSEGGHYLVVSRLQPYKHVDVVIEAFRSMPDKRLLVIGKGPEKERLLALAPDNVRLVEGLSDAQMRWAYANSAALIAASHEDFGLTPLEAGAHGKPVVALRAGGYLDTIREGVNGVFFDQVTPEAIAAGVVELEERPSWSSSEIQAHVATFSEERFIRELHDAVQVHDRTQKTGSRHDA